MDNLNLPQVAANQTQKEVTINAATQQLSGALADYLSISLSSGGHTLSAQEFTSYSGFLISGNTVSRTLTVPATKRARFWVENSGSATLTITVGSTSLSLAAGTISEYQTDGTANGLVLFSSSGGGGGSGIEFTDGTHDLTGVTKITVSGATVGGTSPNATLSISGGGLEITDGVTDLTGVSKITFSGAVVGGTSPNATVAVSGGGGGAGTPPTIVQIGHIDQSSGSDATVTMPSAPTNGNLLIAMGTCNSVSAASGWTALTTNGGGAQEGGVFYKVAGPSETTAQLPCGGSGSGIAMVIFEIAGASGTPFVFSSSTTTTTSPSAVTSPPAPGLANVLALMAITGDAALATFTHAFNFTVDLNVAVSRGLIGGHSDGSSALAQALTTLSSSVSTRSNIVLLTA